MLYTYLRLDGFKRFSLSNITSFEMTIANPLQFFVGSNGSGKSSLMQQLTPLPPNQADFFKTGSKEIHISHHNSNYVLKSIFSPSQKHSFMKDGIELNEGGTVTVQKELVKEHFGMTTDIHELILGEECFTNMSPARRKEWFIRLCDTNYDYAIRTYNRARERQRDTQGALKLARKRLLTETEKQLKTEEEEKLKQEVQALHEQLNFLLEYRKPVENDIDTLHFKQEQHDQQLFKLSTRLNQLITVVGGNQGLSEEQIGKIIAGFNQRITREQTLLQKISEDYSQNEKKIKVLQQAEQQTIESLQTDISRCKGQLERLSNKLLFTLTDFDAFSALNAFLSVKMSLSDIFTSIPSNETKKYSNENLTKARESLAQLQLRQQKLIGTIQQIETKHRHMLEHKDKPDVSCPQCKHRFSLHYDSDTCKSFENQLEHLQKELETEVKVKIKQAEEYINDCLEYSRQYRQYVQILNNVTILRPYWDYLIEKQVITNNPQMGVTELGIIEHDLQLQIEYGEIQNTLNEKQKLLVSLRDVGVADLNALLKTNNEISDAIENHTQRLQKLNLRKDEYLSLGNYLKEIRSYTTKINELIHAKEQLHKDEIETLRRTILNNAIRQLQSHLAGKEHILTQSQMQQSVINNIKTQIDELEIEEQALSKLVDVLSPMDGLIAEGLYGFIKSFVSQMDSFIQKVWNYPLEIKPCLLAEDNSVDLDYKFPVVTFTEQHPIPDVSKGSKGMREIFDLAFRVVAIKCLGLDTALMLDEAGSSFDAEHKSTFIHLVKSLFEQQIFKQLFIISHELSQYSALANADICVLSEMNIVKPAIYNRHVKMS